MLFYPGMTYEIEREGKLASLKMGNRFVFEFDRKAEPKDDKVTPKPDPESEPEEELYPDRVCKVCGRKCKSAYGLRLHMENTHPVAESVAPVESTKAETEAAPA
jgi:hypothetical protein